MTLEKNDNICLPGTEVCCADNSPVRADMEKRVFWMVFLALSLLADVVLPPWWGLAATFPIVCASWWVAYRSDWF